MQTSVFTDNAPTPMGPFSQAIVAGNMIFVSAQLALNTRTGKIVMDDIESETRQVMENIKAILEAAGANYHHVVKASIFLKDMRDYEKINDVYSSYFSVPYPARETIEVAALPKYVNVEISMIAML